MFDRFFRLKPEPKAEALQVGSRSVPLLFVHHPRARRYLLRLRSDGVARVTIPRRGTISVARDFASRNIGWLERQFRRLADQPQKTTEWKAGTEICFRGELIRIEMADPGAIRVGTERIRVSNASADLRPAIQKYLRNLAVQELPRRVMELALQGVDMNRISVRNAPSHASRGLDGLFIFYSILIEQF